MNDSPWDRFMERDPAVSAQIAHADLIQIDFGVIKALRPQKESVFRIGSLYSGEIAVELGMRVFGGKRKVFGAALRIKSAGDSDRFEE